MPALNYEFLLGVKENIQHLLCLCLPHARTLELSSAGQVFLCVTKSIPLFLHPVSWKHTSQTAAFSELGGVATCFKIRMIQKLICINFFYPLLQAQKQNYNILKDQIVMVPEKKLFLTHSNFSAEKPTSKDTLTREKHTAI